MAQDLRGALVANDRRQKAKTMEISDALNKELDKNNIYDIHTIVEIVARNLNVTEAAVLDVYDLMCMDIEESRAW